MNIAKILKSLDINPSSLNKGHWILKSPIDGQSLGKVSFDSVSKIHTKITSSVKAFGIWKNIPAPRRGELIRLLGEELRLVKNDLGYLISVESGKILEEGKGEVQEMIDICDFAQGISRQLYGLTISSERPGHRMMETWHPLGVIGVISAFNFPAAVWSWNFALAIVCGNSIIWKPSEKTLLTALACQNIFYRALKKFGDAPKDLSQIIIGDSTSGSILVNDSRVALISATGSTNMGRAVAPKVAERFGRSLLELGGNNAMIVTPAADLNMALRAITFSAVGTAGQRCTSLRRLIVHHAIAPKLIAQLKKIYSSLKIGNPLENTTHVGPLIDAASFTNMQNALIQAKKDGGKITGGQQIKVKNFNGFYVRPALVEMPKQTDIVRHETFSPILYCMTYKTLDEAIALQNDVPQGLSSCIFTNDIKEAEYFLSAQGSDCGIANVNIGPSGAEIGGAFGGEKETGGGRESGSDCWKNYMRRATNTINYSHQLPLAQGIKFNI
ncbi:MAG: aldehyde dehydrogenase family protein [Alphaproteobacteria bacterium]|nr:aldehyde dehydrogenase family protein [Alphaproteobacteria bacterium]